MSTKKNLPHIPIYIGDWERDCNCLSLEAEMAWMKIVFKMFTGGKQSTYKSPTKSLQILWKSTAEKTQELIDELKANNISDITVENNFVKFVCRRYVRENKISEVRSEAVSVRYKDTKGLQKTYKTLQNVDNDNDSNSNNVIKSKVLKKNKLNIVKNVKKEVLPHFENWLNYRKSIKKPITNKSTLELLVKRFNSESIEKIKWAVNYSIENNYQGLFWDKYKESPSVPLKQKRINHYVYKCPSCSKEYYPRVMKGEDDFDAYRCDENPCQKVGLGKDGKNMVGYQLEFIKRVYQE